MKSACAAPALSLFALPVLARHVKITPTGSHPGEWSANDHALAFGGSGKCVAGS